MHLTHPAHYKEQYIKTHYPEEYKIIADLQGSTWQEKLYMHLHNIVQPPTCASCDIPVRFRNMTEGYSKYCPKCVGTCEEIKNRARATCIKRYGVPTYTNRQKCKETCLKKYGVSNPNLLPEVREKISVTNKIRYGGIGYASTELKEKCVQTLEQRYGVHNIQCVDLLQTYPELVSFENGVWICKCPHPNCTRCSEKTYETNQRTHYTRTHNNIELCTRILPVQKIKTKNTSIELFVQNTLNAHGIEHIDGSFNLISPKQIDIYCPDFQIGIELNGSRWHSDEFKPAKACLHKKQLCEAKGINLLTIWEDQINRIPDVVESVILSKFGIYKSRIGARKCTIKEIGSKECSTFLDQNHIQGRTSSQIRLGAFYEEEMIGVMTFIKSRGCQGSKNKVAGEWELNRFCTKLHTQVVGLTSKMLNYFIKQYHPSTIISFSHNDISTGNVYGKLGFVKEGKINTSYYYIKNNIRYHRSNFTRAGIVRRWPEYDIADRTWTERQVMQLKSYHKIYDCGTQKWRLNVL